jgi:sulfur carrier protein
MTIRVVVNGKPRSVANGQTDSVELLTYLHENQINPRLVAVAINGDVIPRDTFGAASIRDGDVVEIVRMVGGGCR